MSQLIIRPLELREANAFVEANHRHHKRAQGHRFSIGVIDSVGVLHGCAIVGRPVGGTEQRTTLEVTRLCTDGTPNVCSMLYSAAARAGKALGYLKIQTYIYASETGASLRAAGFSFERKAHPSGRHHKRSDGTIRNTTYVTVEKALWSRRLNSVISVITEKE